MKAALASSLLPTQQALHSSTASNKAILIFPIFMALVPLALFADVSDTVLLGYVVFTDFLSVLPLGIKGVELLVLESQEYISTRAIVRGELQSTNTVTAATWSCRCEVGRNLRGFGAALVSIAVVVIIVGVSLEFAVKAKVEKNQRVAKQTMAEFGDRAEYLWDRKAWCAECDCQGSSGVPNASLPSLGGGLIGQLQQQRRENIQRSELPVLGKGL